jgi:transposase
MTIVLETGDFNRFKNAGCYASYCRGVKSVRISNDKKKGQNNRKNGNKYLAYAFVEAANFAIMHYPQVQSWYDRKKKRTNNIVAKKALASKLAKAAWHVMKGEDFDMKMMFG